MGLKEIIQGIIDNDVEEQSFNGEFIQSYLNAWTEFNFTYARILFENETHRLRFGATAKLLMGTGSYSVDINDMEEFIEKFKEREYV